MIDLVCWYADLGRPYQPFLRRMTASAKRHFECRTVILTPKKQPWMADLFDTVAPWKSASYAEVTFDNLMQQRTEATMCWGAHTPRRTLFIDPDVEFIGPPQGFDGSFDIGLMWREFKQSMPINAGCILAEPGQSAFFIKYGNIAVNLPRATHNWYADQLALSLLTGACHPANARLTVEGARVWLMHGPDHCDVAKINTPKAWGVHVKGPLKGEEWRQIYASDTMPIDFVPHPDLEKITL